MTDALTTKDSRAMMLLTPEVWCHVREVLGGESKTAVSWAAAARKASEVAGQPISVATLRQWVARSAEQRAEDEPWIHEIAVFVSGIEELQAGVLEDKLWNFAVEGWEEPVYQGGELVGTKKKHDLKLALTMLGVRDPRYKPTPKTQNNHLHLDASEIYRRFQAEMRMKQIEETGA